MQIRIMGTERGISGLIRDLKRLEVLGWEITDISRFYPNHGDTSKGRVYIDIE